MAKKLVLTDIEIDKFGKKNFELTFSQEVIFIIECKLYCVLQ